MVAYLIADVDVLDAEVFEEYKRDVPASEKAFGGRYLARGGNTQVFEGGWLPHRFVIVEFPDMAAIEAWYNSPAYARLKDIRLKSCNTNIFAVEGIPVEPSPV